jgi:hypothetical protein
MVDEEDQQKQAGKEQHQGAGHRKPGVLRGAVLLRHTNGVEPRGAVGEGGDEHAQHRLVDGVTQEAAEQPW